MTARTRAVRAATRPSHHSACPPKNRPAMPRGEANGAQDRIFADRPDAPSMTGAKTPPTVKTTTTVGPAHHSACPRKKRPAMRGGDVHGVEHRSGAVRPDAPVMTGAKNPPTVMTPMIVRKVVRAVDPTTGDAHTRSAKTDHAVSSSVRANQPSPGSMAKAREVLPDSDSPSSVTSGAATRWMTTSD